MLLAACVAPEPAPADLILRGGTIVDGTGAEAFVADLAIRDGRIAAIGELGDLAAVEVVDVTGLVVAPGFVNIHSHAAPEALPTAVNMLSQGVTTEIVNADGFGPVDLSAQRRAFDAGGLAVNVGAMIGFNSVWRAVVGDEDRRPTPAELERMQELVGAGLDAGAFGVSAGLDYPPGYYARTEEVVAVLEPFGGRGLVFANHDRVTPESGFSSISGMSETLAIGAAAGFVPHVTHMKIQGHEQGRAEEMLGQMRTVAHPGGAPADQYPYLAGMTRFPMLVLPSWVLDGGLEAARTRFADPELRARIVAETNRQLELRFGGVDGVTLLDSDRTLADAQRALGIASAGETVVHLVEAEGMQPMIARFGAEEDLVAILRYPNTSVSCDCGASIAPRAHPRTWGTFPRVLGRYVREQGVLSLEDAVRKMTALPARTIGLADRGALAVGLAADVTVFDAAAVADRATYAAPTEQSVGIVHTIVAGHFAWRDGAATGARAGATLSRPLAPE